MSAVLVKVKEMFSLQQALSREALRLIVDSCQNLKKFGLIEQFGTGSDDDVINVIDLLGKQLTSLHLVGLSITDVSFLYLKNCSR